MHETFKQHNYKTNPVGKTKDIRNSLLYSLTQVHVQLNALGQNNILIWRVNFRLNISKSLLQIFGC